ncbi:UNVERIFIED_CONTAM: hypothetical protein FKN15_075041 [Acipenser sinensis]
MTVLLLLLFEPEGCGLSIPVSVPDWRFAIPLVNSGVAINLGAGGREAVAMEPARTPEHALTTEHNTAQRTHHDLRRRRAQFHARRIVV